MFEGKEAEKQLFKRSISRAPSFAEDGDGAGSELTLSGAAQQLFDAVTQPAGAQQR